MMGSMAICIETSWLIGLDQFFGTFGCNSLVVPQIFICFMIYLCRKSFTRLIPVELPSMTTPEDHLRK
jgi:hypothetical protein